jgi:Fe(3+) dicitrate transport protein
LSLPLTLAYTYTQATFQNSFESEFGPWGTVAEGDELPYVPNHQLAASLGVQYQRVSVTMSGKYTSAMRTAAGQGAILETESTDASLVLDLAADVTVARYAKVFASVRNLTDEVYIAARRPAGLRPGLPRTLMLGIKARL